MNIEPASQPVGTSSDPESLSDASTESVSTEKASDSSGSRDHATMIQVDAVLSHVWMIRTFLKHSDEAAEDEELAEVHRELYDYMLALGPSLDANDPKKYLHLARKKLGKLRQACELFLSIQPEISGHMNFCMAAKSLRISVDEISSLLGE